MKPSTILIAALMALALSYHSLSTDGQPDELTAAQQVSDEVIALENTK